MFHVLNQEIYRFRYPLLNIGTRVDCIVVVGGRLVAFRVTLTDFIFQSKFKPILVFYMHMMLHTVT